MAKTITFLASGTRGDVQPYLALGIGLRDAGFDVRIATHVNFAAMVALTGLAFARLDDNPSDLFARPGGEYALRFDWQHPIRNLRASLKYWRDARPMFVRLLVSAWHAAVGSDALIIGLPTLWGASIAEAMGIPYARCLLQPFTPTRDFPSPLLPFTFSLGAAYNRWSYRLVEQSMRLSWRGAINQVWRQHPEWDEVKSKGLLTLYGFSSHVAPKPGDWLSEKITGYWFLPAPSSWKPSVELEEFLDAGPPPVYIGFGSIRVSEQNKTLEIIRRALTQTGLRAVLSVSHNFTNVRLSENIFPVIDVPHAWLFPRVAAAVHHGGAGTTATGLRAGVPTIVVPLAVDQFFWAKRVSELGVGTRPIPQSVLTSESLSRALAQATSNVVMKARAEILAEKISNEDGVARAVELICARLHPERSSATKEADSSTTLSSAQND